CRGRETRRAAGAVSDTVTTGQTRAEEGGVRPSAGWGRGLPRGKRRVVCEAAVDDGTVAVALVDGRLVLTLAAEDTWGGDPVRPPAGLGSPAARADVVKCPAVPAPSALVVKADAGKDQHPASP
ncbi:hypothetical protein ACFY0G_46130, partial [Streptomyces sp. NPDC001552]|uniref:hypothetical protein n=1 Tax=Streptomyces sp. NPDC001552 TaxID=3364587 RepID=UPI0036BC8B6F